MNEWVESILEHMLEDAQDVITFTEKVGSYESFSQDNMARKAIVMSLLNIGELANHLPSKYTGAHPEIPWSNMIGMRNIAAHGYRTMSLSAIWDTTQNSVPKLLSFLQTQLSERT